MTEPTGSVRTGRLMLAVAALAALVLPIGVVTSAHWSATAADVTFVSDERDAVAYAGPLTTLLVALVDARQAATFGRTPTRRPCGPRWPRSTTSTTRWVRTWARGNGGRTCRPRSTRRWRAGRPAPPR
ncbi:hypothetical protein ACFQX7_39490 [Luedemannella flava]